MKCRKCNNELDPKLGYCPSCGETIAFEDVQRYLEKRENSVGDNIAHLILSLTIGIGIILLFGLAAYHKQAYFLYGLTLTGVSCCLSGITPFVKDKNTVNVINFLVTIVFIAGFAIAWFTFPTYFADKHPYTIQAWAVHVLIGIFLFMGVIRKTISFKKNTKFMG